MVPKAQEAEIVANTILQHYTFRENYFRVFHLEENMRLRLSGGEDTSHREWLLQLGSGLLPVEPGLHPQSIKLPAHLCMDSNAAVGDFIDWVFPDISQHVAHASENAKHDYWFKEKAILTSRNVPYVTSL